VVNKRRRRKVTRGRLKQFNATDLIPFKAGRNIRGHCDLNEEGKFVENLSVLMNE